MGLILIETNDSPVPDTEKYRGICRDAQARGDRVVFCGNKGAGSEFSLPASQDAPPYISPQLVSFPLDEEGLNLLSLDRENAIAFLAGDGDWVYPEFDKIGSMDNGLLPWAIAAAPADCSSRIAQRPVRGWIMSSALAASLLRSARSTTGLALVAVVDRVRAGKLPVKWLSATVRFEGDQPLPAAGVEPAIRSDARVLALIPHYLCEEWLEQCLKSLADQTRPLDGVIVMDDASHEPPIDLCRAFPNVTLVQSPSTVGPYRLVQSVVRQTSFDAYMFQDSDDWSACDRLEKLLAAAEYHAADLIGCQQVRLLHQKNDLFTMTFPLDVNWGLADGPSHGLAHPTSLVSRRLLERTEGYSSGMGFGADSEFLNRAVFVARVVNTPFLSYFWRGRPASLTNSPDTGHASPIRQKMQQTLYRFYWAAHRDHQAGKGISLTPLCPCEPIELRHLSGPRLLRN
jgi:hypothetical protein